MRNLKYLLLIVLTIGLVSAGAVFAQSGKVLVNGKLTLRQSDIDTIIDFYEWAFEGHFTGEQRKRFQEYTIAEFESNPAAGRRAIDDIVTTFPKIQAAGEDVQKETRETFVGAFLEEARKNSDENSRMLIAIYESAHGDAAEQEVGRAVQEDEVPVANDDDNGSEGVGDLSAIGGEWVWARSGSMTKTTSGVYLGSNGSRFTYKFMPGGRVEYTGIMETMQGGCRLQAFNAAKGTATMSGDTLTIKLGPTNFSRDDACSPAKNYKKVMPAKTEVYKVRFKNDYGQKQLCLTSSDEMCYSPK